MSTRQISFEGLQNAKQTIFFDTRTVRARASQKTTAKGGRLCRRSAIGLITCPAFALRMMAALRKLAVIRRSRRKHFPIRGSGRRRSVPRKVGFKWGRHSPLIISRASGRHTSAFSASLLPLTIRTGGCNILHKCRRSLSFAAHSAEGGPAPVREAVSQRHITRRVFLGNPGTRRSSLCRRGLLPAYAHQPARCFASRSLLLDSLPRWQCALGCDRRSSRCVMKFFTDYSAASSTVRRNARVRANALPKRSSAPDYTQQRLRLSPAFSQLS